MRDGGIRMRVQAKVMPPINKKTAWFNRKDGRNGRVATANYMGACQKSANLGGRCLYLIGQKS